MSVKVEQLARALYEATEGKSEAEISEITQNTFSYLKGKNLASKTPDLIDAYERIWEKENGVLRATVTSRKELSESERKEIAEFLKGKFKSEHVVLEAKIDESILGGMKIEAGETVIDLTLNQSISQLEQYLK